MLGSSIALAPAIGKVQHINWPGERRFGSWNALVLWSLYVTKGGFPPIKNHVYALPSCCEVAHRKPRRHFHQIWSHLGGRDVRI